jgi:hypothetical protein
LFPSEVSAHAAPRNRKGDRLGHRGRAAIRQR